MNFKKQLRGLTDWDKDDLLDLVGLETRRTSADSLVPILAAFGVGVVVGVGVGLLIAQKPGSQLRDEMRERISSGYDNLKKEGVAPQPPARSV